MCEHFIDLQNAIVQAYSDHRNGAEITLPPEDVSLKNSHLLLSQRDTENACALALAFLGIADSPTPETSSLRWLMRNFFLNPKFRGTLSLRIEAERSAKRLIPTPYLLPWKVMHRVRGVVAKHLESIGDTLPISFTEPLFSNGRVPTAELPRLEDILNWEFDLDVRQINLEGNSIEAIVDMANRIELLSALSLSMDAP